MTSLFWYPGYEIALNDITRAENCSLYDAGGRRYVDLESGVWCTSIGHGHPRVLGVITEQAGRIAHTGFSYSSQIVEESAREILSVPGFEGGRCVFLCSGSEAVEYGVRVARSAMNRPLMMTMADSYFGAYGAASTKQESDWYCFDWLQCSGCPESKMCDEHCERWSAIPRGSIGGFLFEPGSSSGLVRFPPRKLIRSITEFVEQNEGLLLVNEVTTGVGRTGMWFGYQHYGITPHIVALGKGIGNGYPVAVAAFAPGVIDRLGGETVKYAQSHQNDPLGAAVAREVVRIIREERLIERSAGISAVLIDGLEGIRERTSRIEQIRARGLMAAIELRDDAHASLTIQVQRELLCRGFVIARRPGLKVLRLDPALTIERQDIEDFLTNFEAVLTKGNRSGCSE